MFNKKNVSKVVRKSLAAVLAFALLLAGGTGSAGMFPGLEVTEVFAEDMSSVDVTTQADAGYDMYNSTRIDIRDESIYSIMITRFYDGDTGNNVHCWDDGQAGNPDSDPAWRGDFAGLLEKLDYIQAMGFTAICLTPVTVNASGYDYHGFHSIDFSNIDPRLESDGFTYQDVIDACHIRGLKVIQQISLNSTGNFGEVNLLEIMKRTGFSDDVSADMKVGQMTMEDGSAVTQEMYDAMPANQQYSLRLENLKKSNLWRSHDSMNWDDYTSQISSIAGDCVDLNTENPVVYNYLVDVYSDYIKMGVDGFWIDSSRHISRLTFNKVFNDAFIKAGREMNKDFVIYGDGVIRSYDVWYQEQPGLSNPFYTWDESNEYEWSDTDSTVNEASAVKLTQDMVGKVSEQPTSSNAVLDGISYHTPDYSQASGMYMNDYQFMWSSGCGLASWFPTLVASDKYYNDATFNIVSLENFDYGPDDSQSVRKSRSLQEWKEQLAVMFLFRGVPMIYQGTEVEFKLGKPYDIGPNAPLSETIRAYYGDMLEGDVDVTGTLCYGNATGTLAETLSNPIAQYIQRMNLLRREIPALRKGQYTTSSDYISGASGAAFIKRYTDENIDNLVLVSVSGGATFKNIPNGKYIDAMTGDAKNVTNGTLTVSGLPQGHVRIYVCCATGFTGIDGIIGSENYSGEGLGNEIKYDTISGIDYIVATDIEVSTEPVNILDTGSVQITANVLPEGAINNRLIWSTSDESIAVVSDGLVKGVNAGTATIKVRITGTDICKEITVNVTEDPNHIYPETIVVTPASVTLNVGENKTVTPTFTPENVTKKTVKWMSYDETIATVDGEGNITAVADGMTSVVGTIPNGNKVVVPVTVGTEISLDDDITVEPGSSVAANVIYYADKPDNWNDTINIYSWDNSGNQPCGSWPGTAMSYDEDLGMYYLEYDESAELVNVIFNDGSQQTGDLLATGNCYNGTTNEWSDYRIQPGGKVIIDYHATDGVIFSRKIVTGSIDSEYSFSANTYDGYALSSEPANANGVCSYEGSVVSYVYGSLVLADPVEAFVERMYTVVLGRDAEEAGLNNWVTVLKAGTHDGAGIAAEFVLGEEFKLKNLDNSAFLDVLYKTFFNREADEAGKAFWMSVLEAGNTREFVLSNFVNLDEFTLVCEAYGIQRGVLFENGAACNPGVVQFVNRLYTLVMGRAADKDGLYLWTLSLTVGAETATSAGKSFFNGAEYALKATDNMTYVKDLYAVFMGREADESGLDYWANTVLGAGFTRDWVLEEFAKSDEFKAIAAGYGLN